MKKKGKQCNHIVKGMEHKRHWQAPSSVNPSHKEKDEQADHIQNTPEIAKELQHLRFRGKLVINSVIKLIIHYGDDHIGHKGQDKNDFD